jgi:hypothetical protein
MPVPPGLRRPIGEDSIPRREGRTFANRQEDEATIPSAGGKAVVASGIVAQEVARLHKTCDAPEANTVPRLKTDHLIRRDDKVTI